MDLVFSILTMVRGHEESVTKSRRMLAAFEQKRRDAVNGTERNPFTRMLPAWLRWNETTRQYEVIEDRAKIVRESSLRRTLAGANTVSPAPSTNNRSRPELS